MAAGRHEASRAALLLVLVTVVLLALAMPASASAGDAGPPACFPERTLLKVAALWDPDEGEPLGHLGGPTVVRIEAQGYGADADWADVAIHSPVQMRARLAASQLLVFARRTIPIWDGFAWYERGTPLRVIGRRPGQALVTWGEPDPAPVPAVWVACDALSARSPYRIRHDHCRGGEVELPHRVAGRPMRVERDEGETPTLHDVRGRDRSIAISSLSVGASRRRGRVVVEHEEAGLHARGRLAGARVRSPGPYGYGSASLCCPGWLPRPRTSDPRLRLARASGLRASPGAEAWLSLRAGAEVVRMDEPTEDGAGWRSGIVPVWLDLGEGSRLSLQGWIDASALEGAVRFDPRATSRCVRP